MSSRKSSLMYIMDTSHILLITLNKFGFYPLTAVARDIYMEAMVTNKQSTDGSDKSGSNILLQKYFGERKMLQEENK